MAAGDIQPDGTIELAPGQEFQCFASSGRVLISRGSLAQAEAHGWTVIAETDEEVAKAIGRSSSGLILVERKEPE